MKRYLIDIACAAFEKHRGLRINEDELVFMVKSSRNLDLIQVFIKGILEPVYIFRVAGTDEAKQKLDRHCRILDLLSGSASAAIRSSVPRIYSRTQLSGDEVVLEQAMHGVLLNTVLGGQTKGACAITATVLRITEWLIALQQATARTRQPISEFIKGAYFRQTLADYEEQTGHFSSGEQEQIGAFLQGILRSNEIGVTLSVQHNDFSGYNMLLHEPSGLISVMDWEYGEEEGLTLIDLFNFLVVLASESRGIKESRTREFNPRSFSHNILTVIPDERDLSAVLFDDPWLAGLCRTCVDMFISATGFDRRLIPLSIFLFILRNLKQCPECLELFLCRKGELKFTGAE